jgi:TolB-like protein/Flp pilus assembly protein TadD
VHDAAERRVTAAASPAPVSRAPLALGLLAFSLVAAAAAWVWLRAREPASPVTLVVLPFENIGNDPERAYLADGLAEETRASLRQIGPEHLRVIGRKSQMAYERSKASLADLGREPGVAYLVESSIRADDERLRVTARLIRMRDQVQVWSGSFERQPASVLELPWELSTAIAGQIKLSPQRPTQARRQPENPEAYHLYLRGRFHFSQLTPQNIVYAIEYYRRATALDPNYALAWSGLAEAYAASTINGDAAPLKVWPLAREAVAVAIRAAPELAETQTSLGFLKLFLDWDWPAAEAAFRQAIALDKNYPLPYRTLGVALSHAGRHVDARAVMQRARELDPYEAMNASLSAHLAFQARDYAAAIDFARQAIVVDPDFWVGYFQLAQAYEQVGKADLALEALANAAQFSKDNSQAIGLRGYLLAKQGRTAEARDVVKGLEALSTVKYVPPYAVALVHAGLGEHEAALEWLERAYEVRDVHLMLLPMDPKWNFYRADPRFQRFLDRCGFPRTPLSN